MQNENAASSLVTARNVVVSSAVYNLEVFKKAAYRFLEKAAPSFSVSDDAITCTFAFRRPLSQSAADAFVRDVEAELLDQDLRERVAKETAQVRTAVLALAFAPANSPGRE